MVAIALYVCKAGFPDLLSKRLGCANLDHRRWVVEEFHLCASPGGIRLVLAIIVAVAFL
jgi:hypothetical protein